MSRNKYSSFRTAERVWKTLFKANVTVLLLVLIKNVNISRLNRIGRQLQPVKLAAGELADNFSLVLCSISVKRRLQTAECEPGVKCRLSVKCRLQTRVKRRLG